MHQQWCPAVVQILLGQVVSSLRVPIVVLFPLSFALVAVLSIVVVDVFLHNIFVKRPERKLTR